MRKTIIAIMKIIIITIACLFVVSLVFGTFKTQKEYIRGKFGIKCYEEGQEHKNIKYKIKFNTMEECLLSIQQ